MSKVSHIFKTTIFALGLASIILAPITRAMADDDYDDNNDGYNHNYNYSRPYYNRHYYNRHYRYGGGYYGSHHGGHGGEVALGILTGGLLFYALTSNSRSRHNNRTVYVQQRPVYIQPNRQQWIAQTQYRPQYGNNSCRQVREYQTTITIGNQTVPAYGKSCLQPDGSWKLGPATPEPGN